MVSSSVNTALIHSGRECLRSGNIHLLPLAVGLQAIRVRSVSWSDRLLTRRTSAKRELMSQFETNRAGLKDCPDITRNYFLRSTCGTESLEADSTCRQRATDADTVAPFVSTFVAASSASRSNG